MQIGSLCNQDIDDFPQDLNGTETFHLSSVLFDESFKCNQKQNLDDYNWNVD